jgi:hypothetical protein
LSRLARILPQRGGAASAPPAAAPPGVDPELLAKRDRLIERFTVMQADLGGLFYEMAIRDHVRMDVLTRRAAELQRVDAELGQVERLLRSETTGIAGSCPSCEAPQARGAVFCWQCGRPLIAVDPIDASA